MYRDPLIFVILWVNSADDKLIVFCFLISPKKGFDISCKLSPRGDNLHELSKPVFLGKIKKNISKCRLLKILFNNHAHWSLPRGKGVYATVV